MAMNLEDFGYNDAFEASRIELQLGDFAIGRIISEHKERYVVKTTQGDLEAEISGNLRFTAAGREDFPAVGDWTALLLYDTGPAIIHRILPRFSMISRRAPGQPGEAQVIAANIDSALLLRAADRDFNMNRLERYLTICHTSSVAPVIVLTKTDLNPEQRNEEILDGITARIPDVPVFSISNETLQGYEVLLRSIEKGKTYCMLGSSGVGKSTLLNNLAHGASMKTAAISQSTQKGRHTTSHRELFVLCNGAILIDNPGMREVGIADTVSGLETAFDRITGLAYLCRYKDCTHTEETGCAVLEAVENGEIDPGSYENYLKMLKEKTHFESSLTERRRREKEFGRMVKDFKKDRNNTRY